MVTSPLEYSLTIGLSDMSMKFKLNKIKGTKSLNSIKTVGVKSQDLSEKLRYCTNYVINVGVVPSAYGPFPVNLS